MRKNVLAIGLALIRANPLLVSGRRRWGVQKVDVGGLKKSKIAISQIQRVWWGGVEWGVSGV